MALSKDEEAIFMYAENCLNVEKRRILFASNKIFSAWFRKLLNEISREIRFCNLLFEIS
jgi:hypothetical protein